MEKSAPADLEEKVKTYTPLSPSVFSSDPSLGWQEMRLAWPWKWVNVYWIVVSFLPLDRSGFYWKVGRQELLKAPSYLEAKVFGQVKQPMISIASLIFPLYSSSLIPLCFWRRPALARPPWVSARYYVGWLSSFPEACSDPGEWKQLPNPKRILPCASLSHSLPFTWQR